MWTARRLSPGLQRAGRWGRPRRPARRRARGAGPSAGAWRGAPGRRSAARRLVGGLALRPGRARRLRRRVEVALGLVRAQAVRHPLPTLPGRGGWRPRGPGGSGRGGHLRHDVVEERVDVRVDLVARNVPRTASSVFRPSPVMTSTTRSSRPMSPRSASLASVAVVTPPAVSVKIPVVSASRRMPARISSSVTASIAPPVSARELERVGPVGRVADRQRLGDRVGLDGPQRSSPAANAVATGEQPVACAPLHRRQRPVDEPEVAQLARSPWRPS